MIDTLIRRIAQSAVVVLAMSLLAFVGIHLVGDPVYLLVDPAATAAEMDAARQSLGLDRPIHEQYLRFLGGALSGDLGRSFVFNQPALGLILGDLIHHTIRQNRFVEPTFWNGLRIRAAFDQQP